MATNYVFPAIFKPLDEGGYFIRFPDLSGAMSEGKSVSNAMYMARDVLSLTLLDRLEDGVEIPPPSNPADIPLEEGEFTTLIDCDPAAYAKMLNTRAVRKTISLPEWMVDHVKAEHINLSRFVQDALTEELQRPAK